MYNKMLVAVDDSEQAGRALEAACELARLSGGSVHVLHVRERQVVVGKGGGSFEVEPDDDAAKIMARATEAVEGAGVPVTSKMVHAVLGHVAGEIIAAADEADADTIVMGSHGRSGLAAVVLGSNAYKVVHLADRPVLVVR